MTTESALVDVDIRAHAQVLASAGLRVVPIAPGKKVPMLTAWQTAATDDHDTIDAWWSGLYRGHGVGIRTGWIGDDRCLVVVDIDTIDHGADGAVALEQLEREHGPLPPTVEAITGSGGRHLFFLADHEIRNSAGQIGDGIDIRGEGGFVVAAPTLHPNGRRYEWVTSPTEATMAALPHWLADLARRPTIDAAPRVAVDHTGDRPGDIFARSVTWAELLQGDGWSYSGQGRDGEDRWTRPGKETRDGISATTNYGGADTLKVFSGNCPPLNAEETYSKLGYIAATRHHGDHGAAARALAADGYRAPDADLSWIQAEHAARTVDADGQQLHGWEEVDIAEVLSGDYDPPTPDVMRTSTGRHLFYSGRVNAVQGESGSGKSWIALAACHEQIADGRHTLYVDLEDHAASVVARLIALDVSRDDIAEHLHYVQPGRSWTMDAGDYLAGIITAHDVALVVIDSTGEAMANDGVEQNDDGPVAQWMRRLPRALANLGPCVLLVDHVVKDKEKRGLFAIGSQRKRAAIDGAAFLLEARISPAKGTTGRLTLTNAKDRNGYWQQGEKAADVTVRSDGETVEIELEGHDPGEPWRPTVLMERITEHLAVVGEASTNKVQTEVTGNKKAIAAALAVMLAEGTVTCRQTTGRAGGKQWSLVDSEAWIPASDPRTSATSPNLLLTSATGDLADVETEPPPPPPPPLQGGGEGEVRGSEAVVETVTTSAKPQPVEYPNPFAINEDGF